MTDLMPSDVSVTPAEPLLDVRGLRVGRAGSSAGTGTIVSSVSLSLRAGETIGIVGESGSGKSMTAKAITGLLPPGISASGEVRYGGRNLLTLREKEWRAVRGTEIGLVLQDPFTMLNPVLRCGTILGESLLDQGKLGRAGRRAEAVRRLAEVGITDPDRAGAHQAKRRLHDQAARVRAPPGFRLAGRPRRAEPGRCGDVTGRVKHASVLNSR